MYIHFNQTTSKTRKQCVKSLHNTQIYKKYAILEYKTLSWGGKGCHKTAMKLKEAITNTYSSGNLRWGWIIFKMWV